MSILQNKPKVHGFIEISYSSMRKAEMAKVSEKNCVLLVNRLKDTLEDNGANVIATLIPEEKDRFADIIYEITTEKEEDLQRLERAIKDKGGKSVNKISIFVTE